MNVDAVGDVVLDDAVCYQRAQDRFGMFMAGLHDGENRRHRRLAQRVGRLAPPGVDVDAQFTASFFRPDL